MNCKWCNKELNGANDYHLVEFCDIHCRMLGGDSDKIDLNAEVSAAPRVVIDLPNPPIVVRVPNIEQLPPQDVIPSLEDFFSKPSLKG